MKINLEGPFTAGELADYLSHVWRAVAAFPEIVRRVWFDDEEADRG